MRRKIIANLFNRIIVIISVLLVSSGCSFKFKEFIKPDPAEFDNVVFDTSFSDTWAAIEQVATGEKLPINVRDKDADIAIIETQKILEFNPKRLYRQYVTLYAEIRRVSVNFTSVSIKYILSRYDPTSHKWRTISGINRQKKFLSKVKQTLEIG